MDRIRTLSTTGSAVLLALVCSVGASQAVQLAADGTSDVSDVARKPEVVIHDAPTSLTLREDGRVRVKASPPAAPGDPVVLNTAGSYNAGYVRVDETVLDENLTATLKVPGRKYLGSYNYWASVPGSADYQEGSSGSFPIEIVSPAPQDRPACGGVTPVKADGTPWVCTFSDEFNGPELDRRYWVPQESFTTGTKIKYACALDSPSTIDVQNGNLLLSLVDLGESRDCGKNRSSQFAFGQVMHYQTYAQTYGKYVVRAKVPDLRVPGSQQSFWLWPESNTYGPWPASGEIDFAELYSSNPGIDKPYLHYLPGDSPDGTNENRTHTECPIKVGEYNTYGVIWEPGTITILLNGRVCMVNDYSSVVAGEESTAPFDHPFYLSLNQAMGNLGNEYDADLVPDVLTTQIDYVRVWR
ncbi:MAG: glycoside hydrolase family 16 protein [Propionibacteriales bacterium]|nr:glycoside hydrolase family 16 protein [Propionibacteriales bacterium]